MPHPAEELPRLPHTTAEQSRRTGDWRFTRPVLEEDDCIMCNRCIEMCPDVSIHESDSGEYVEVDYDFCKGCGICAEVCPTDAFVMEVE